MSNEPTVPVLVVGAGPAGLVAALTLRLNGVPVRIIEKEETVRNIGQRGAGLMPRSQELLRSLGVLDDILKLSAGVPQMRMYKLPGGTEPLVTFHMDPYAAPTPSRPISNLVMLGQSSTEKVLRTHLAGLGCEVEFGTTLVSLQQDEDGVTAHITKRSGDKDVPEVIRCRWLVGTDGARGAARKQLGLIFSGKTWPNPIVIADVEIPEFDNGELYWHYWGDMSTVLVSFRATEKPGLYSIMLGGKIDVDKVVSEREELVRIVKLGTGRADIPLGNIRVISIFRPSARMTETFRRGRVLIAGDAAHVHTPFGGQGLNSSIQDAANLGWKLALVEQGVAAPALLDSYTQERAPVIAEMLKLSSHLFDNFLLDKTGGPDPAAVWRRGGDLHQFGVNYRWSPIVVDERSPRENVATDPYGHNRSPTDVVQAGDRAPDAPGLVVLSSTGHPGHETTSLFTLFGISHHTVLIFSDGKGTESIVSVLDALRMCPSQLLRAILIHRDTDASAPSLLDGAHLSAVDRDNHAHDAYQVGVGEFMVVIVRPDGTVGGVVRSVEGIRRYFNGIFRSPGGKPSGSAFKL